MPGVGESGRWTGELALALDETPAQLQPAAGLAQIGGQQARSAHFF